MGSVIEFKQFPCELGLASVYWIWRLLQKNCEYWMDAFPNAKYSRVTRQILFCYFINSIYNGSVTQLPKLMQLIKIYNINPFNCSIHDEKIFTHTIPVSVGNFVRIFNAWAAGKALEKPRLFCMFQLLDNSANKLFEIRN